MDEANPVVLILIGGLAAALAWGRPRDAAFWSFVAFAYAAVEITVLGRGGMAIVQQSVAIAFVSAVAAAIGIRDREPRD